MAKRDIATNRKEVEKKAIKFYELIKKIYPVKKIIIYGSYAKGAPRKDSDIDVGVVVDLSEDIDTAKITSRLFHYASKVDSSIEPLCILWSEYQNCEKASILAEIIRTGIEVV